MALPWCHRQLQAAVRRTATTLSDAETQVGIVDCDKNAKFCREMGIEAYPALRYFKKGGSKRGAALDDGAYGNLDRSALLEIFSQGVLASASVEQAQHGHSHGSKASATNERAARRRGGDAEDGDDAFEWSDFDDGEWDADDDDGDDAVDDDDDDERGWGAPPPRRRARSSGAINETDGAEEDGVVLVIAVTAIAGMFLVMLFTVSSESEHGRTHAQPVDSHRRGQGQKQGVAARSELGDFLERGGLSAEHCSIAVEGLAAVGVCTIQDLVLIPVDMLRELQDIRAFGEGWSDEAHEHLVQIKLQIKRQNRSAPKASLGESKHAGTRGH
eukprot:SAG11_NODE_1566_length_4673_cov_3.640796_4_plen_329_part_00